MQQMSGCPTVFLALPTKPSTETFESKTIYDKHTKLSTLSHAELIARAKNLNKMVAQSQTKANRYYTLYLKEKQKKCKSTQKLQPQIIRPCKINGILPLRICGLLKILCSMFSSPLSCNRLSEFVSFQFPLHMHRL